MPVKYKLTDAQISERKLYNEIGWPYLLTPAQLELYEMKSIDTLKRYLLGRDDAPFISFDRGGVIPRLAWEKFKAVVSVGGTYSGEL